MYCGGGREAFFKKGGLDNTRPQKHQKRRAKKQGGAISHLFFNSAYSIILLCLPQKNMCAEREGKKHLFTISAVCFLPSLPFSGSFRFFLALYARLFIVFALSNFA
jgi:hypothetical protein